MPDNLLPINQRYFQSISDSALQVQTSSVKDKRRVYSKLKKLTGRYKENYVGERVLIDAIWYSTIILWIHDICLHTTILKPEATIHDRQK